MINGKINETLMFKKQSAKRILTFSKREARLNVHCLFAVYQFYWTQTFQCFTFCA